MIFVTALHERWNVRARHGEMEIVRMRWSAPPAAPEGKEEGEAETEVAPALPAERFLVLTLSRGRRTQPMHAPLAPQEGDEVAIALHTPERETTLAWLEQRGWSRVPDPEAEAVAEEA